MKLCANVVTISQFDGRTDGRTEIPRQYRAVSVIGK